VKYFVVATMWLSVYLLSKGFHSSGVGFFSIQAVWSLILIAIGLAFYPSSFVVALSTLELSAIIINTGAAIGYKWEANLFYHHYGQLLTVVDMLCLLCFAFWYPYNAGLIRNWHNIHAYMSKLLGGLSNRGGT